jgi:hypothetical protein
MEIIIIKERGRYDEEGRRRRYCRNKDTDLEEGLRFARGLEFPALAQEEREK